MSDIVETLYGNYPQWKYVLDKAAWSRVEAAIRADERAKCEALMDSQYRAGAQAGWNAAQSDDPEATFAKLIKSRAGCVAAIRAGEKP